MNIPPRKAGGGHSGPSPVLGHDSGTGRTVVTGTGGKGVMTCAYKCHSIVSALCVGRLHVFFYVSVYEARVKGQHYSPLARSL